MALNSFSFVLFFACVYVCLWGIKIIGNFSGRDIFNVNKIFLIGASYLFLGLSNWKFCIWLFVLTIISYWVTIKIDMLRRNNKKYKWCIILGTFLALFILGIFKYYDFFVSSFNEICDKDYATLNLIIPIGISFYVFSAISYMVDIYRNKYEVDKNFLNIVLYIAFFPKLVSGPIIRANEFLKQIQEKRTVNLKNLEIGIQIFVVGMFKKVVLADHLCVFVDDVFHAPIAYSSVSCIMAVISYSLQIYFDFSGYSDLAIGIAKMLGFDFQNNFNLPYISLNVTEFWKRWHISLSSWLQEYLYYSLGGNRKGKVLQYRNLFITMLLGGLWHGASWNFVIWGGLHGIGLIIHKNFMNLKKKKLGLAKATNKIWSFCSAIITFIFVTLCWVFFRADSFDVALEVFKGIFVWRTGILQVYSWTIIAAVILIISIFVAKRKSIKEGKEEINGFYPILDLNKWWSLVLFFTFCGLVLLTGYYGNTAFIYGKF